MKKVGPRKLSLSRETLHVLNQDSLEQAAGGTTVTIAIFTAGVTVGVLITYDMTNRCTEMGELISQ